MFCDQSKVLFYRSVDIFFDVIDIIWAKQLFSIAETTAKGVYLFLAPFVSPEELFWEVLVQA